MTKDRLNELRAAQSDESSTLLDDNNDGGHLKIEIATNTSRYQVSKNPKKNEKKKQTETDKAIDQVQQKVKEIKELIEKIEDETISLRRIQNIILQSVFNDNSLFKLEESMKLIKTASVSARGGLRELDAMKMGLMHKNEPHSRLLIRVLSTQLPILQKQYVNAMNGYQNALVTHKEKTEKRIKEQLQIVDKDVTNEELEDLLDKQDASVFVGNYIQETMDTRQKLQDARARHKELLKLEMAITELHDMFIEMATLIENQGEVIDRIENYVGQGVDNIENGKIELMKAKENKDKSRKKKMFLMVCLGSVLLLVILSVVTEIYLTFSRP